MIERLFFLNLMAFRMLGEILEELAVNIETGKLCGCQMRLEPDRGDSVLEQMYWHMLRKSEKGWHGAVDQFQIGAFRVDCLINCDGKLVVVELDGAKYHNALDDELRDRELLKSVDAIIRVPFAAMWYYRYAVFAVMSEWFPRFKMRAEHQLTLSLDEFREELNADDLYCQESYLDEAEDSYNIWEVGGDMGLVGSPSGFLGQTRKRHRVWVQRGTPDRSLHDRLWQKSQCREIQEWVS